VRFATVSQVSSVGEENIDNNFHVARTTAFAHRKSLQSNVWLMHALYCGMLLQFTIANAEWAAESLTRTDVGSEVMASVKHMVTHHM
jgi:hypothetical protein